MYLRAGGLGEATALALPTACAACAETDATVCRECLASVTAARWSGGPATVTPSPCPAGLPPTHATARFEGALGRLVAAYKDKGRRDCRHLLSGLLAESVDAALRDSPQATRMLRRGDGPVLLVPTPSSRQARRRRGDAPLTAMARGAAAGFLPHEVLLADALRLRRRVADQAGLSARQRAANLEHAMEVRSPWREHLRGACCVVVDDVLTTGATLVEARRALLAEGASSVVAATVCATVRRYPQRSQ